MLPEELERIVIDVLRDVEDISGRQWNGIALNASPIGTLPGFDSQSGIEATVGIELKLGCEFGVDSVFVSADGRRALTVKEIAERIAALIKETQGAER